MRSFLLAATFVAAMAPAAFAGHADKDGPFAHANDNQIGSSTPYPGSPVVNTDKDGQITANFATTWPKTDEGGPGAIAGSGYAATRGAIGGSSPLGVAPNASLAAKP